MNVWIVSLSHLLHVIGSVLWIGGIIMILWVILPSSKNAIESASMAGKFMKEVAQRFTPLANISILLLICSGIVITFNDTKFDSILELSKPWSAVIFIKLALVAVMILIHFYRGLILNQKILNVSAQASDTQVARLKKISLNLVKTNFTLGIVVLMLAAVSISL